MNKLRFWQIDVARGAAVFGMMVYHFLVDLEMIYQIPVGVFKIPVVLLARSVATLFILLVGMSAAIKYEKIKSQKIIEIYLNFGKQALEVLIWAIIISGVTIVLFPDEPIFFGVLHFIAMAMILVIPFLFISNDYLVLVTGTLFLGLGLLVIPGIKLTNYWLLPLGLVPSTFSSLDYYPLLPWFGLILIGLVGGRWYWKRKIIQKNLSPCPNYGLIKALGYMGTISLRIYLLHQPILWVVLLIIKKTF